MNPSASPKTFELSWGTLAGKHWQAAERAPLAVALHGWLDNAASFDAMAPHFTKAGISLLALDLAGHGLSAHRAPGQAYHFIDYVLDITEATEKLNEGAPIHWVGHSLGGGVALYCAAAQSQLAKSLTLVDSPGPLALTPEQLPDRLIHYLEKKRLLKEPRDAPKESAPANGKALQERLVAARKKVGGISEHSARVLIERNTELTPQGSLRWISDPRLRLPSAFRFSEAQITAFIKKVHCPTLILESTLGLSHTHRAAWKQRVQSFANAKHIQVEGGHHVHMDHPERSAKPIVEHILLADKQTQRG